MTGVGQVELVGPGAVCDRSAPVTAIQQERLPCQMWL